MKAHATTSQEVEQLCGRVFPNLQARPREEMENLFRGGQRGFSGADADLSMPLGQGRSLWIFGDTLVGPRSSFQMPRNSVGILKRDRRGQWAFDYYWNEQNGKASSFFVPDHAGEWLWPGTMCEVEGKLYFFLRRFKTNNAIRSEAFRFRYLGPYALYVDNPKETPDRWKPVPLRTPPLARSIMWSSTCFAHPEGFLHLWGFGRGHRPHGTFMARCPLEALSRPSRLKWEYYSGKPQGAAWTRETRALQPLFPAWAAEMSLFYLKRQRVFVTVFGNHRTNTIGLQVASRIEGPWSRYHEIYRPPDAAWSRNYFCYAPKAHPEMNSDPGELLITYITNSHRAADLISDQRIYYPRFIALPYGVNRAPSKG